MAAGPLAANAYARTRIALRIFICKCECNLTEYFGGSQKGGFQKGGFGGCSPGTKTGTRVRSPKPPFWKPPFSLPMTLFGVDKRVVSKRVVSADVPPERKPERGYVRQNHPFTKPPFYLPGNINSNNDFFPARLIQTRGKQTRGNDTCEATGMTARYP